MGYSPSGSDCRAKVDAARDLVVTSVLPGHQRVFSTRVTEAYRRVLKPENNYHRNTIITLIIFSGEDG